MNINKLFFDHGNVFPMPLIVGGIVVILMGLGLISEGEFLYILGGIGLIVLGAYITFSKTGVEVDLINKRFRIYSRYFGFLIGDWKNFEKYPYSTVLRNRYSSSTFSRSNREVSQSEVVFEIFLLNKNHRSKIFVKQFNTLEEAKKAIQTFSEQCGIKWVKYNPR